MNAPDPDTVDARRTLLRGLFDDAGLFPPASLPVPEAAAGHIRARGGPHAWMLGRFVCSASKLSDVIEHARGEPFRVSVILDTADAAMRAGEAAVRSAGAIIIEQSEAKLPATPPEDAIAGLLARAGEWPLFIEIPVAAIAVVTMVEGQTGIGVKIRCGGDVIPSAGSVAATIAACRDAGVRFKATAGLHHPRRTDDRHGFLNLCAATVAASQGASEDDIAAIVDERDPSAIALESSALTVRGRSYDPAACVAAREMLLASIGSCSFDEPVEDLIAMGIL
ncbi:MAG TPA: hypothetical protein VGB64_01895 [Actinomycetota bacterium]